MNPHYLISMATLGGLLILTSCKESASSGHGHITDAEDAKLAAELAGRAHVLYSEQQLLPVGTITTTTETRTIKDASLKIVMPKKTINGIMTKNGELVQVTKIDSSTQRTVEIKKDGNSGSALINGQPTPQPSTTKPLHGMTAVFTRSENGWTGKLKNGNANSQQLVAIKKMAQTMNSSNDKVIFGTEPYELGDSWNIDPSRLSSFGGGVDKMNGKFKVTFQSFKKHQGHDCAEIVSNIDLEGEDENGLKMRLIGNVTTLQSLKYRTQLSFHMDGQIVIARPVMGSVGMMHAEGPMKLIRESVLKFP